MSYSAILEIQKNLNENPAFSMRKCGMLARHQRLRSNWASQRFIRKFSSKALSIFKHYSYMLHTFKPQNTSQRLIHTLKKTLKYPWGLVIPNWDNPSPQGLKRCNNSQPIKPYKGKPIVHGVIHPEVQALNKICYYTIIAKCFQDLYIQVLIHAQHLYARPNNLKRGGFHSVVHVPTPEKKFYYSQYPPYKLSSA